MKNLLLIAQREYLATVKTKAFIIGLILMPILMGGSGIGMALLHDKVDTHDRSIVILDPTGQIAPALVAAAEKRNANDLYDKEGKKKKPAYLFEIVKPRPDDLPAQRLELSDQVRSGDHDGFVEIGSNILNPSKSDTLAEKVCFYSKNSVVDDLRGWLINPVNDRIRELRLLELGIDPEGVKDLFRWHSIEGMELVEADESGNAKDAQKVNEAIALGVPLLMMIIMFMMVMMGAMPLLNSVMEEKNQHIAETILSSATPFQFMFGKVLGGVGVSLTGSALYIGGTIFVLVNMGFVGYVPFHLIPWFIIYIVLAILMMGSIMASIGSACSDVRESQNLTLPAMLPIMIPMFVMMPVIKEPLSGFATTLSLIPPFTPLLMMLRQSVPGGVPAWQPIAGMIGLVLFTLLSIWVGSRIFRVGILAKGKTPSFFTLLKWSIKG